MALNGLSCADVPLRNSLTQNVGVSLTEKNYR